jgi:catechol 2,3-dioxygenase-like lactoylglutathione lyase family enzyme
MGKLRHIAIQVPDLEKAAAFYEGVFGFKRLKKVDAPIGKARGQCGRSRRAGSRRQCR